MLSMCVMKSVRTIVYETLIGERRSPIRSLSGREACLP